MGANDGDTDAFDWEKPAHEVTLSSYSIGQTEVTQALWVAVMGSNPSYFTSANGYTDDLNRPVECVSWDDCQTFIHKLNQITGRQFRLPTEAEWEFAARGRNKSLIYKYSGSNNIENVAWYYGNSDEITHKVSAKAPNDLSLYDMSGNVWEWCQDNWSIYSNSSQTNPTGPSTGSYRICRGGSWYNDAKYCRVSYRDNSYPTDTFNDLGLRLAL